MLLLALLLICQTPDITLVVPEKPVSFARTVKMKVQVPPKGPAPADYETFIVDWDVTERRVVDSPLEDDLDIDSNSLKASIPSGLSPTSIKIRVDVTFIYKDYSTRVARQVKYVEIGPGPGPNVPVPPGPVNPPVPTPVPTPVPPGPIPVPIPTPPVKFTETYGIYSWSILQLSQQALPKDQAAALALAFDDVLRRIKANEFTTKEQVVAAVAEKNRAALGANLTAWVDGYLAPLQGKLNPLNPRVKTIQDQSVLFTEIRQALIEYSSNG